MVEIRLGSRGSVLALLQAVEVLQALESSFPDISVRIVKIKTSGDIVLDRPLSDIGGKGLFIKETEEALLANEIDMAVHSAKDVPAFHADGLQIPCVLKRMSPYDVLVSSRYACMNFLPRRARVGTSSIRRKVQLLFLRPELDIVPLRGNIDTRINKALAEEFDAIILAEAGIVRIAQRQVIREVLKPDVMLSAVGQGAVCVQCRAGDDKVLSMLHVLNDIKSYTAILAERSFMKAVNGSCHTPLAALAEYVSEDIVSMRCMLARDEHSFLFLERKFSDKDAEAAGFAMGLELKDKLASKGA